MLINDEITNPVEQKVQVREVICQFASFCLLARGHCRCFFPKSVTFF